MSRKPINKKAFIKGTELWKKAQQGDVEKYSMALKRFEEAAETGHFDSALIAGFMHREGVGTSFLDGKRSAYFFEIAYEKSKEQGNKQGQIDLVKELSAMYMKGKHGLKISYDKAITFLNKAAELGDVQSSIFKQKICGLIFGVLDACKKTFDAFPNEDSKAVLHKEIKDYLRNGVVETTNFGNENRVTLLDYVDQKEIDKMRKEIAKEVVSEAEKKESEPQKVEEAEKEAARKRIDDKLQEIIDKSDLRGLESGDQPDPFINFVAGLDGTERDALESDLKGLPPKSSVKPKSVNPAAKSSNTKGKVGK